MTKKPEFSVLLPTKERLDLLVNAVETVRMQDFEDWEIVISDNASETCDIKGYVEGLKDPRIKYIRCKHPVTVTENWNNALNAASGAYIVMLGDDDGLTPQYFMRCKAYLTTLDNPDFIYHSAYHFAFPNVLNDVPEGFVKDITPSQKIFSGHSMPFILEEGQAHNCAIAALDMKLKYSFNMQYFLFSRECIEKMRAYGDVFQGPYPDFYAANMAFLIADRIGIIPQPLTVIGISPKSYGFFHFSNDEDSAVSFLNNDNYALEASDEIKNAFLPGSQMNTQWLISVANVKKHLQDRNLKLGLARYQREQILNTILTAHMCKRSIFNPIQTLWPKLNTSARLILLIYFILALPLRVLPKSLKNGYSRFLLSTTGQYETPVQIVGQKFTSLWMKLFGLKQARPWEAVFIADNQENVKDVYHLLSRKAGHSL